MAETANTVFSEASTRKALADARNALQSAFAPIEGLFQGAGETLGDAVTSVRDITQSCHLLSRSMAEDALSSSMTRLQSALSGVTELAAKAGGGKDSLAALTALTDDMEKRILRLSRTIDEVEILGINAKIEAAQVTAQNVDFSVFTREIGRLAELAAESLGKLGTELASLGRLIASAQAEQDAFERDNQQSLSAVVQRLEGNLRKISERQKTAARASGNLADLSEKIAHRVAQAVSDLQIADITRQRVEHVCHALKVAEDLLDAAQGPNGEADRGLAVVAAVCRLEAAQLRNAEANFSREIDRIVTNLKGLTREADEIRQQGDTVCGSSERGGASFLTELGNDFDQVKLLLEKYAGSRGKIEGVIHSVSAGVSEMVKYLTAVHSIEADMRVMGLNATLKCSRLGKDGRALSVIAQELRVFANRTADDGDVIMQGLERLIAAADGLARGGESAEGKAIGDLLEEMDGAVSALETANGELERPMATLNREGPRVGAALDDTVRRVTSHREGPISLRRVVDDLESLASAAPDTGGRDPAEIKETVLRLMKGRYTMAAEHEIHSLFDDMDGTSALGSSVGPSSGQKADAAANVDDFLF
jgi:hypothetical protein